MLHILMKKNEKIMSQRDMKKSCYVLDFSNKCDFGNIYHSLDYPPVFCINTLSFNLFILL